MTENGLEVRALSKSFGGKPAVRALSFSVAPGAAFSLLGGNGAGKTTTLNMLLGFLQPDAGKASYGGLDLWRDRQRCRGQIFYLPESVSLYPEFSAVENLSYLLDLAGIARGKREIAAALQDNGLAPEHHSVPAGRYSKGMRQKVALTLARLKGASLLLLDEPTSGLDPAAIKEFVRLIRGLKAEGAAVVMVTHDLQCAHLLADEIGILQAGVMVRRIHNRDVSLDRIEAEYFSSAS